MNKKIPIKSSMGIALCRRHPTFGPQILLVKSRITYSFSGFVFGKYKIWDTNRLNLLIAGTTAEERLLMSNCDFSKLWFHIWLHIPESSESDSIYQFYTSSRVKFERLIMKDSGKRLKSLLSNAPPAADLGWDIPGGKPEYKLNGERETELETAQREMFEESGVNSDEYHILHNLKPICVSFEDENVIYVRKYFIAKTDKEIKITIDYLNLTQIGEVSAIEWYNLKSLRNIVAQNKCLRKQAKLALKLALKQKLN